MDILNKYIIKAFSLKASDLEEDAYREFIKEVESFSNRIVIEELERMSDILLLENEHKPIDKRIEELKRKD